MKKGPFKLKYKNSAFPFKASPAKFGKQYQAGLGDSIARGRLERGDVPKDRSHTHTSDYIVDPEQGDETSGGRKWAV